MEETEKGEREDTMCTGARPCGAYAYFPGR